MGLSIHYRGTLTDKRQSAALLSELEDIGKSMHWPTQVLDGHWDRKPDARLERNSAGLPDVVGESGLKGVILQIHQDCATLYFCFSASGVLTSPLQVAVSAVDNYAVTPNWITVHTQSAGPEMHAAVIRLLRYLQEKIFARPGGGRRKRILGVQRLCGCAERAEPGSVWQRRTRPKGCTAQAPRAKRYCCED